jgi:hypothetical protein
LGNPTIPHLKPIVLPDPSRDIAASEFIEARHTRAKGAKRRLPT